MKTIKSKDLNIEGLVESLKMGKVVIFPTDTVYGIICDVNNKKAVDGLFKIKQRNKTKPIPIFVKNIKMAKCIAVINNKQEKYLKSVWPGKITVVLERKKGVKLYGVNKDKIALRIPDCELVKSLFRKIDFPVSGTSANISGESSSVNINNVISQFENQKYKPDIIIDNGNLLNNKPSTIIDLTIYPPKKLRQ
jgi:L-threonylcarbamoyladenylate synthase